MSIVLWIAAAALAGLYLRRVGDPPERARTLLKTTSVLLLALLVLLAGGPVLLVLALAACATGDAFLAQKGETALRAGMGAFGIGHFIYIVLFANAGGGVGWDALRLLFQFATLGGVLYLARGLWPALGDMRAAVAVYGVLVVLTALLSLGLPTSLWLVTLGALLFLISDAILAAEMFKLPADSPARRWTSPAVWTLYWLGQAAITAGFLYPIR